MTIPFSALLTILFIALKLTGYITWGWVWVLAPAWIGAAVGIVMVALVAMIAGFASKITTKRRW